MYSEIMHVRQMRIVAILNLDILYSDKLFSANLRPRFPLFDQNFDNYRTVFTIYNKMGRFMRAVSLLYIKIYHGILTLSQVVKLKIFLDVHSWKIKYIRQKALSLGKSIVDIKVKSY